NRLIEGFKTCNSFPFNKAPEKPLILSGFQASEPAVPLQQGCNRMETMKFYVSWATGRHRIEQSVTFCRSRTAGFGPQFFAKAADVENKRLDWKSQISLATG